MTILLPLGKSDSPLKYIRMETQELIFAEPMKEESGTLLHFTGGVQHLLPSTSMNDFLDQLVEWGATEDIVRISRGAIINKKFTYGISQDNEVILKSGRLYEHLRIGTTKAYRQAVKSLGLFIRSS